MFPIGSSSLEKLSKEEQTRVVIIPAHRRRRRHGRATLDVILWPMKIDARLETEAGPRRTRGLAVSNPRIRVLINRRLEASVFGYAQPDSCNCSRGVKPFAQAA